MSRNLYLKVDGHNVGLLQTPTDITLQCLRAGGSNGGKIFGENAKRAIQRYIQWLYDDLEKIKRKNKKDYYWAKQNADEHVEDLNSLLQNAETIEVYAM